MQNFRDEMVQTREFEPRGTAAAPVFEAREFESRQFEPRQFEQRQPVNSEMVTRLPAREFEPRSAAAMPPVTIEREREREPVQAKAVEQPAPRNKYEGFVPAVTLDGDGNKRYSSWAVEVLDAKQYTVREGEDLATIARRSLGVSGHPDATKAEIKAEMKRIAELNCLNEPGLAKHQKGHLRNGTTLLLQARPHAAASGRNAVEALPAVQLEDCGQNY